MRRSDLAIFDPCGVAGEAGFFGWLVFDLAIQRRNDIRFSDLNGWKQVVSEDPDLMLLKIGCEDHQKKIRV
jgi:hypothetical protein